MKSETLQENKDIAKTKLEGMLGRPASPNEIANSETDALLLVLSLREQVINLTERVILLEK